MRRFIASWLVALTICQSAYATQMSLTGAGPIQAAASGGGGTVTVNATGTKLYHSTADTSLSYTGLTIAAGTNRALVVGIAWDTNGTTPTGVSMTWDSGGTNQALSLIVAQEHGAGIGSGSELWGLVNPTTGNKTLAVSWTTNSRAFVVGMAFNGVNQTGGATTFPHTANATSVATVTVTSATGNIVMAQGTAGVPVGTITGTTIYSDSVSGCCTNAYANYDNGAASVVIGQSNTNDTIAATDIKAN